MYINNERLGNTKHQLSSNFVFLSIYLVYKVILVKQLMAVIVPLRCNVHRILVVDGQLLPHLEGLGGDDGDLHTKPWMVQPAPPSVGCLGMVCLVSQASAVLVKPRRRICMLRVQIFI